MIASHGLRRTRLARAALAYLLSQKRSRLTHAQVHHSVQERLGGALNRATLYRLLNRLTESGLLVRRTDAQGVRRYQVDRMGGNGAEPVAPHFECQRCLRDSAIGAADWLDTLAFRQAAESALQGLRAAGCENLSLDLSLRGICADCAASSGAPGPCAS